MGYVNKKTPQSTKIPYGATSTVFMPSSSDNLIIRALKFCIRKTCKHILDYSYIGKASLCFVASLCDET